MFGRHPRLPIDVEYDPPAYSNELSEPTADQIKLAMTNLLSAREETKEKASKNIEEAQEKQKEYYDRKRSPETFADGTEVLVENTAQKQRKGGKLTDKWLGPYIINRHISKGLYKTQKQIWKGAC